MAAERAPKLRLSPDPPGWQNAIAVLVAQTQENKEMAEGWRQVWEDMRHALLGADSAEKARQDAAQEEASQAARTVAQEKEAAVEQPVSAAEGSIDDEHLGQQVEGDDEGGPGSHSAGVITLETGKPGENGPRLVVVESARAMPPLSSPWAAADEVPETETAQAEESGPRWRRWLAPSLAALALLAAAVWLAFSSGWWARLTAPAPPADDVIATYEGGQITIDDVEEHLNLLLPHEGETQPVPDEILLTIEDMVMDRLVQRWAATRQPEQEEDFSHAMAHINEGINLSSLDTQLHEEQIQVPESEIRAYYEENREQFGELGLNEVREQIRQTLVAQREQDYVDNYLQRLKENASVTRNFELLDVPEPTEDELRRYYEENRVQYRQPAQVVVDELQIPIGEDEAAARQAADDALLRLRSGAPFTSVPQEVTSAQMDGNVSVSEGTSETGWEEVVFALTEGELSDVFRVGNAFYIVRLQEKEEERQQGFEEVRPLLEAAVRPQVMDAWFEANESKTLFTLKGNGYTTGEFYREYQELPLTVQAQYSGAEGMKALAEQLIERLLLVMDANEQLLDVQNQPLSDEARLQVMRQMLHQEEVDDKIEISEEEIQQFYDENQQLMALPPQTRIRYIRIGLGNSPEEAEAARERADEAYRKLAPGLFQEGEPFAEVAQEYSEDPETAANGGEMPGWIGGDSGDLLTDLEQYAFTDAVLALQPGEISRPFEFDGSLYIVEVIERTEPEQLPLEEARPFIEEILRQQEHETVQAELQTRLLEEANLQIYEPVLMDYLQQFPTPEPFFPLFEPTPVP